MTTQGSARTPLYDAHVAAGARLTHFAGYSMPLHYGSQLAEHRLVRVGAGMFDVSHMAVTDLAGDGARDFLARVMSNDPDKARPGRAVYTMLLNESGGVVDDVIVYGRDNGYRVVSNAATREKVRAWFDRHAASFQVALRERRDLALLAVQGPQALEIFTATQGVDVAALAPFTSLEDAGSLYARTGYTGEDGLEVILPGEQAVQLWDRLRASGVSPAGLAARDTLRVEAGLMLYGQDMDDATTPLESALGWTVAWDPPSRAFLGREALARQRAAKAARVLKGIVLTAKRIMRPGCVVQTGAGEGEITSGIFSPTLGFSIGFARIPRNAAGDCRVVIRGKPLPGRIVKLPFVRRGKQVFE